MHLVELSGMMYVRAFAALVVCDALVAPAVTTRRASSLRAYKTPDLVSVFARLAETTCVSEDGTTQTAKAGKWIPAYAKRGDHVPAWVGALFPDGATDVGFDAFHAALGAMTPEAGYRSVECVDDPDQYVVDVATRAGTLVLFDTVASPHEVLPTEAGARVAAAGWFHEPAQEPPDWY